MNNSFKFNKEFGLRLGDRFDGTYYSLLIISVFITMIVVLILANLNYQELSWQAEQIIRDRYKELAATFIIEEEQSNKVSELITSAAQLLIRQAEQQAAKNRNETEEAVDRIIEERNLNRRTQIKDRYADLPEVEDYVGNMEDIAAGQLTRGSGGWPNSKNSGGRRDINNYDAGDLDDMMKRPFNYILSRRGSIYIDFTDEMMRDPETPRGYRDPKEIERVIEKNQPMIEHCFRKEARNNLRLRGFVKVEFRISYEGFVMPESIRIVNSTVRSKKVEQCIKNYIRRWRNFSELDEEMGIARVVQKFVFN